METDDTDNLVSLTPFHRYLCSLDYYSDFKDKITTINNSIETKDEDVAAQPQPIVGEKINLRFESSYEYINEWEEMFLLEAKAQIIRGGATEKTSHDDFFLKSIEADDTFFIMTFKLKPPAAGLYRVFDFVVVAKEDVETTHPARYSSRNPHDWHRRLLQRRHT
jgi:rRNA maturation protein Nop10